MKQRWIRGWVTMLTLSFELLVFCFNLPQYTTVEAVRVIERSEENIEVIEVHSIDTLEPLNYFINKGYVLTCKKLKSEQLKTIFFNPVSGEYYKMG